jgi:hypothetical protein
VSRFTARPAQRGPRAFSWSYSKLKNYEVCPQRHYQVDIAKAFKDEEGEQLAWGNQLHDVLAKAIGKGEPLPKGFEKYQPWVDKMLEGEFKVDVELKLAITENFEPCAFFDDKAWFRGVIDVLKRTTAVALIGDWKAGKILEDSVQLALFAQLIFSHYPNIQKVRTEFIWLKHDATTREDFDRRDMQELWAALAPRVDMLKQAHTTGEYPVKPGGLCRRYCPVTSCVHHGG